MGLEPRSPCCATTNLNSTLPKDKLLNGVLFWGQWGEYKDSPLQREDFLHKRQFRQKMMTKITATLTILFPI